MADGTSQLLCVAPRCRARGRHLETCEDRSECAGCSPRLAEVGHLCAGCFDRTDQRLNDIARLSTELPAHLEHTDGTGQRVSGSVEAPTPLRLDVHDLAADARPASLTVRERGDWWAVPGGDPDQVGHLSVATELDFWVRDWIDVRAQHEQLPEPTVDALVVWLWNRLEWAAGNHPAVDEFVTTVARLHGVLRSVLGETDPRPQPCDGVPCRRCDLLTLVYKTDGSGDVECTNPDCCAVLRRSEYDEWVRLVAAHAARWRACYRVRGR